MRDDGATLALWATVQRPAHETRRARVMETGTEINQPDEPKEDIACHRRESSRS
jgi:hypothetical protein